jgi:hypothetical protein
LFCFKGFDTATDKAHMTAEALIELPAIPHLYRAITSEMAARAPNKAGGTTIRTTKPRPVVFVGIM